MSIPHREAVPKWMGKQGHRVRVAEGCRATTMTAALQHRISGAPRPDRWQLLGTLLQEAGGDEWAWGWGGLDPAGPSGHKASLLPIQGLPFPPGSSGKDATGPHRHAHFTQAMDTLWYKYFPNQEGTYLYSNEVVDLKSDCGQASWDFIC